MDDKLNGRGIDVMASGDRYEGEYQDGVRRGQGVFTWANGNRYVVRLIIDPRMFV